MSARGDRDFCISGSGFEHVIPRARVHFGNVISTESIVRGVERDPGAVGVGAPWPSDSRVHARRTALGEQDSRFSCGLRSLRVDEDCGGGARVAE